MKRFLFTLTLGLVALVGCKKEPAPGQEPGTEQFETTANCYIVSEQGTYSFKTVKGNSSYPVGEVASAAVLWESFGTHKTPEVGDLIKKVSYNNGEITFKTTDKKGNAVIAAKDADGNILWSWHIWLTDQPQEQEYEHYAGTMMDRNLGATSATPGDVGALGLLYQWGRKDPFLGSSSISSSTVAKSTITWPSAVESNSSTGTVAYATANPTTFISYSYNIDGSPYDSNYDWYYTGSTSADNSRWTTSETSKSICDPCPSGWRVPDVSIWSKAFGTTSGFDCGFDVVNCGVNFGNGWDIWYPASGYRDDSYGILDKVGISGACWSASPDDSFAITMSFSQGGSMSLYRYSTRASGYSVRCIKE